MKSIVFSHIGFYNLIQITSMVTYILIIIGAVFALIGIILFIKGIGAKTSSKLKFLALEFESKGSSLIIFLVGAALIAFGATSGNKSDKTAGETEDNKTNNPTSTNTTVVMDQTGMIDKAIQDITTESSNWRTVLQRVVAELAKDNSSRIREDAQNLVNRSMAAGIETGCNTDFLAKMAIASLQWLKAKSTGDNSIAPLRPAFCQLTPHQINLNNIQGTIPKIIIHGYDLDRADASGNKILFYLLKGNGEKELISNERISRQNHYQVSLNVEDMAKKFYNDKIAKIVSTWNNSSESCPEVAIIPWSGEQRPDREVLGTTSFMPGKISRNDGDFDTHHNEHMSVSVQGEIMLADANTLKCRVYMRAKEERSDWTEVRGYSEWFTAYTSPPGWKISSFRPNANSTYNGNITTHGQHTYYRPAGEIVQRFVVWGDHEGDEAGTWTRVDVHWNPIELIIEKLAPTWAR